MEGLNGAGSSEELLPISKKLGRLSTLAYSGANSSQNANYLTAIRLLLVTAIFFFSMRGISYPTPPDGYYNGEWYAPDPGSGATIIDYFDYPVFVGGTNYLVIDISNTYWVEHVLVPTDATVPLDDPCDPDAMSQGTVFKSRIIRLTGPIPPPPCLDAAGIAAYFTSYLESPPALISNEWGDWELKGQTGNFAVIQYVSCQQCTGADGSIFGCGALAGSVGSFGVYRQVRPAIEIPPCGCGPHNCPNPTDVYDETQCTCVPCGGLTNDSCIASFGPSYRVDLSTCTCEVCAGITCQPSWELDISSCTCILCIDNDQDGHSAVSPFCPSGDDPNDNDPTIYAGAPELCDGKDNNGNGQTDEECNGSSDTNKCVGSAGNLESGNLFLSQDIIIPKGAGLKAGLTLYYNSLDATGGPLGRGWRHTYSTGISTGAAGTTEHATITMPDGKGVYFSGAAGGGDFIPNQSSGNHSTILRGVEGVFTQVEKGGLARDFSSDGKIAAMYDKNMNSLSFSYGGTNLATIVDSTGRTTMFSYDNNQRIASVTDAASRTHTFTYGADGLLASVTDQAGTGWRFTYDTAGRLHTKTDLSGNTTAYEYYADGKLQSVTDPNGLTKTISYNPAESSAIVTEKDGGIWTYKYDPRLHVLLEVTDPLGGKTIYGYDTNGNRTSETDHNGNVTYYTYDENGNVTSITNPQGNVTISTYDAGSNLTSVTDPQGNTTYYSYGGGGGIKPASVSTGESVRSAQGLNRAGNLVTIFDPSGVETEYTYDDRGNTTSVTVWSSEGSPTTAMTYDQYNNLLSVTEPLGATTSFTYDIAGNMTSQTDANGAATLYEYNAIDQLVRVTDPIGNITSYTYDANGNRSSMTDPKGNVTRYEYDYSGRVTKITDGLSNVTGYTYGGTGCQSCSGADKLTRVTDAEGHTISYEYDQAGRTTKMTDQLGRQETYTYDGNGNMLSMTDRKGQTTSYTYDGMNRRSQIDYADGSYTTYDYDSLGRVTTINDSVSGTITYTYSTADMGIPVGKVLSESTPLGTINYSYDSMGRRISMGLDGYPAIWYYYDGDGRLTSIEAIAAGYRKYFDFYYDAAGKRTLTVYPTDGYALYSYDGASRIASLYHLDPLDYPLESIEYTYDAASNRTVMDRANVSPPKPAAALNILFNEANHMLTFNSNPITYDNNGNMTSWTNSCGTTAYTWDVRNRLVGITVFKPDCSELTASFKYDALGRRIEKTINERTTQYIYDGNDIVQEIDSGLPSANYIRTLSIDEPLARIDAATNTIRYYHADALGSIIGLSDESGQMVTKYAYDAFGQVAISGEISDNPFQYTGRENDGTGLYYYRARYYSPELQRFVSEDPIRLEGGTVNFYEYANDNPLIFFDSKGLRVEKCCGMNSDMPKDLVATGLGCMSKCLKCTIYISSGWRDEDQNDNAGGADKSYHLKGLAADVHIPPSMDRLRKAATHCGFYVLPKQYPNRIHVDLRGNRMPKKDPDECECKQIRGEK